MASSSSPDSVAEAIREVSAEVIMPRFGHWDGRRHGRNPGDLVTVADQLAEQARWTSRLFDLTGVGCCR